MGEVRIEAAAFRGRPVWFEVIPAWRPVDDGVPARPTIGQSVTGIIGFGLALCILLGAGLLARRNFRLRCGDPRGAMRLAILVAVLGTAQDILITSNSASNFIGVFFNNLAMRTLGAAGVWLFYMAIEPYVRRLWPDSLIAWSRMLEGRLRDPMVGRHLLFGALAGMGVSALQFLPSAAPWLGLPPPEPFGGGGELVALGEFSHTVSVYFGIARQSLSTPVLTLLVVLLLRVILRRPWRAYLVFLGIVVVFVSLLPISLPIKLATILIKALGVLILTRLGLFAMLISIGFSEWDNLPLTLDPTSWYFPYAVVSMLLFAAVAIYGFVISLGGQLVFKDPVLD